jgi:hypothetical protein
MTVHPDVRQVWVRERFATLGPECDFLHMQLARPSRLGDIVAKRPLSPES